MFIAFSSHITDIPQAGKLQAGLDAIFALEKQTRNVCIY